MATLQQQARALGDPTRHAIFQRIADSRDPLGIRELNEAFDLNHNAIRQHLAKLVAAGLLVETKASPAGRGRPRLVYAVNAATASQWGSTGPYEQLSRLLAEIISTGLSAEEVGRRAAERFQVPTPSGDIVADLTAAMARQGFDPEVRAVPGGAEVVLRSCPFATTAAVNRATVCALHLGIAEGLADGSGAVVEELIGYEPGTADCRLRIRLEPGPPSARRGHKAEKAEKAGPTLTLRG